MGDILLMNKDKINKIAHTMNIDPGSMNKVEMIRLIQEKEGNTACFKTDRASCDQYGCRWRSDCQPGALIPLPQGSMPCRTSAAPN